MKPHFCRTSDGSNILCFCIRDEDHNQEEFDIPVEAIGDKHE